MSYKATEDGALEFPTHEDLVTVFTSPESPQPTGGFEQVSDDPEDAIFKARYVPREEVITAADTFPIPHSHYTLYNEHSTFNHKNPATSPGWGNHPRNRGFLDALKEALASVNPFGTKTRAPDGAMEMEMQVQGDDQENLLSSLINRVSVIVEGEGTNSDGPSLRNPNFTQIVIPTVLGVMILVVLGLEIVQFAMPQRVPSSEYQLQPVKHVGDDIYTINKIVSDPKHKYEGDVMPTIEPSYVGRWEPSDFEHKESFDSRNSHDSQNDKDPHMEPHIDNIKDDVAKHPVYAANLMDDNQSLPPVRVVDRRRVQRMLNDHPVNDNNKADISRRRLTEV